MYHVVHTEIDANDASLAALLNGQEALGYDLVGLYPLIIPGRSASRMIVVLKAAPKTESAMPTTKKVTQVRENGKKTQPKRS